MNTSFENFNLHIEKSSEKDSYIASVQDEKGNKLADNEFQYYIDHSVLSHLEYSVGKNIPENAKLIKEFGTGLFNVVFNGEILGCYKSRIKDKKQIRLKFILRKEDPELLRIPWEFIFDGTNFLSAYPQITMSRVLKGMPCDERGKIEGTIKILAVISSPLDLKDNERLQIEKEQMYILHAVDAAYAVNTIDLEFLDEASLRKIQAKLDEEEYHILHYTGHGVYHENQGYLLLEDDSGKKTHVDNDRFANLLAGYPSLRLVVLSGCQTAKTSGREAFTDLTTPLLQKKIPAVVSMQYSVSDRSALDLAKKFYTEISNGIPIDQALTRARKELLLNKGPGTIDFATPVLFSDDPDCLATEVVKSESQACYIVERQKRLPP